MAGKAMEISKEGWMREVIRQILQTLNGRFGAPIFTNPKQFKAALESVPIEAEAKKVRKLLNTAIDDMRAYSRLESATDNPFIIDNLVAEMVSDYWPEKATAQMAIECVAELLGHVPNGQTQRREGHMSDDMNNVFPNAGTSAKSALPVLFVIDRSGSMYGARINSVNTAMRETIPILRGVNDSDVELKIAVLQFSNSCKWMHPQSPVSPDSFQWSDLEADGETDLGAAFKELSAKLSEEEFLAESYVSSATLAPIIFLVMDGEPTDDYKGGIVELQKNVRFKCAKKIAVTVPPIDKDADKDAFMKKFKEFIGDDWDVINMNDYNPDALKEWVRSPPPGPTLEEINASQIQKQETPVGRQAIEQTGAGATGADDGFEDCIKKIVGKHGTSIFGESRRLKSLLLDYAKGEGFADYELLLDLINIETDCIDNISKTENLAKYKQILAGRLEKERSRSREKSTKMLDSLFRALCWKWRVVCVKGNRMLGNSIVEFSPDGKFIATVGSAFNTVLKLWNAENEQIIHTLEGHGKAVSCVAFSQDGRYIVSGSFDNTLKLWSVESGQLVHTFEGHGKGVLSVAFSPSGGSVVSGSDDNTLMLWNVETGRLMRTFEGHSQGVLSVAFSPRGDYIASSSGDGTLKLWSAETEQLVRTFEEHGNNAAPSLAFSPDGKFLVSTAFFGSKMKLWETETGKNVRMFGYGHIISSVSFSPDGKFIVSRSSQGANTLKVWETENGQFFRDFKADGNSQLFAAFGSGEN